MNRLSKIFLIASLISTFLPTASTALENNYTQTQQKVIANVFKSLVSSNTDKIAIAQKKYIASNSSAYYFVDLIRNHHSTVKYFKSINTYGLPTGTAVAAEPSGKFKFTKNVVNFNSIEDEFDGIITKIEFDKKGKITSWTMADGSGNNAIKLSDRITILTSKFEGSGFKVDKGYLLKQTCLLYTSPSPRDATLSRMPSSA